MFFKIVHEVSFCKLPAQMVVKYKASLNILYNIRGGFTFTGIACTSAIKAEVKGLYLYHL
ncbi:MAG: hypothetical protein E6Q24_10750 [Chitinophagaceae bacterium]|nr:MAG: hypothetical protein E6Q24_10750 [Chitinophagaceae bacterium]